MALKMNPFTGGGPAVFFTILRERTYYRAALFTGLTLFAAAAFLVSLRFGSLKLGMWDIVQTLFSQDGGVNRQIIWNIRLPRNLTAAMCGICLSISGAILQGVMRNPLAAPNIIGVSAGGGLAALIILIVLPKYYHLLVPAAFTGALGATLSIYLLAWKNGAHPMRLVLAGVAVSSLLGAFINALLIFYPDRVAGTLDFLIGGFAARSWKHVSIIWPYALCGGLFAWIMARRLNILTLGDATAAGLGLKVESTRLIFIALASLLAAAAVSVAGLLGFVGLIAPHTMRLIVGSDYRVLIPACALFSAGLLMLCDTLGRMVMDPVELPVGILMALLGGPFFLWLLRGRLRSEN